MPEQRPESERRLRQAERLARQLRLLKLIMGNGRWDAEALAEELGCSVRTIHRLLQSLQMAGIPWKFDKTLQAYRVPAGFKFPGLNDASGTPNKNKPTPDLRQIKTMAKQLVLDGQRFLKSIEQFHESLG
jgi:DNA-binding Lrp family transcriptional regulator